MTMTAWINGLSSIAIDVTVLMQTFSSMIDTNATERLPSAAGSRTLHFSLLPRIARITFIIIVLLSYHWIKPLISLSSENS
jgi:hypothetical protein